LRFSPQIDRVWKRNPSRVFLLNILGGLIIVAILGSLFYPVYLASRPGAKLRHLQQEKGWLPWSPEFWADPQKYLRVLS